MLVFVLALCLGLASAQTEPGCDACINGLCYVANKYVDVTLMFMNGIPAFEMTENRLYFTSEEIPYYAIMPENITDFITKRRVPQVPYNWAVGSTVDQKTRELYIWMAHRDKFYGYPSNLKNCSFVFNPITERMEEVHNTDEAIKEMHFKNTLYYTLKFRNGLFKYESNNYRNIPPFDGYNISQFVVDKLEDIYASTEHGVYRLKKGDDHVIPVSFKKYSVAIDKDENVYFMDQVDKTVLNLDYHTDHIYKVGAFNSEAKDRFIFDKYNRILVISGEQPHVYQNWVFMEPKEGCRINVDHEGKKIFVKVSESVWKGLSRIFQ